MPAELAVFVAAAKSHGAQDEFLADLLRRRGWSAKAVQSAFELYYESQTGLPVPRQHADRDSARDAFLHLLAFTTLSIWAWGLVALVFDLLDHWMPDAVVNNPYLSPVAQDAAHMARLFIAYPAFLWVMWLIGKQEAANSARPYSPPARWLAYLCLFLTATAVIFDLIIAVEYLLRGELTARFILKTLTVLLVASGIFLFFLEGLRTTDTTAGAAAPAKGRLARPLMIAGSTLVLAALTAGFGAIGGPLHNRQLEADLKRVDDLRGLSEQIHSGWTMSRVDVSARKLPSRLQDVPPNGVQVNIVDPETKARYEYFPGVGAGYQLCAVFIGPGGLRGPGQGPSAWRHPAGRHCFSFDANMTY